MRDQIIKRLNEIKANSKTKDIWVIEFEGQRLSFSSGKGSWLSIGAAKNALRNHMPMGSLPALKQLEGEGVVKYTNL